MGKEDKNIQSGFFSQINLHTYMYLICKGASKKIFYLHIYMSADKQRVKLFIASGFKLLDLLIFHFFFIIEDLHKNP